MRHHIISIGKPVSGALLEIFNSYKKQFIKAITLHEVHLKHSQSGASPSKKDIQKILSLIPEKSFVICLDEKGAELSSNELADLLKTTCLTQTSDFCYVIGGPDGHFPEILSRAHKKISFGRVTWPHHLMKVLLIEQIYRAEKIIEGHPYHRDS